MDSRDPVGILNLCIFLGVLFRMSVQTLSCLRRMANVIVAGVGLSLLSPYSSADAQTLTQQRGAALDVDIIKEAQRLSMRDVYARSLYSHIRANPTVFQNPNFYVSFLIYLMSQDPEFDCTRAFSSEFERRDYFTQAFKIQGQLAELINSVTISDRFDVAFNIPTGRYDFATGQLPLDGATAVDLRQPLRGSVSALAASQRNNARQCAQQILTNTNVEADQFPWSFSLINEAGENREPAFPFSGTLPLSDADARQLFERFGRQLYAIVSYQVRAANDGSRQIQVLATDGQLFGLSSDAVVRVKSYAHPTLSQPNYLDVTNAFELNLDAIATQVELSLQQQGFRAIGTGTRTGNGTDFSAAVSSPVSGSGAVGNSGFILRLSSPGLQLAARNNVGLNPIPGAQQYLTIYGSVDFEGITEREAPVSGTFLIQQLNPQSGELDSSSGQRFTGSFKAPGTAQEPEEAPEAPASELDELVIDE